jgi:hypothetical protein
MPHSTARGYKVTLANQHSTIMALTDVVKASRDAVEAQKDEMRRHMTGEAMLKGEIVKCAKYARLLSGVLNETRFDFDGADPAITTTLDDHLPVLDSITVIKRTTVLLGIVINRLKGLNAYHATHKQAIENLVTELTLAKPVLQDSIKCRREAYIIGPSITQSEMEDLDHAHEALLVMRAEVDPTEIYDGIDTDELPLV